MSGNQTVAVDLLFAAKREKEDLRARLKSAEQRAEAAERREKAMRDALERATYGRVIEPVGAVHRSGRFCTVCGMNDVSRLHSAGCWVRFAESAMTGPDNA